MEKYIYIVVLVAMLFSSCNKEKKEELARREAMKANFAKAEIALKTFKNLSFMDYDYINHDYKYLDEEYRIVADSSTFMSIVEKEGRDIYMITTYRDSLEVIMRAEFDNDDYRRAAFSQIGMTWQRLGYMLLKSPGETELLVKKHGITLPYAFYQFMINEENDDKEVLTLLKDIQVQLKDCSPYNLRKLSRKELLNEALYYSPHRMADSGQGQGEQVGCGRKNCCQLEK